MTYVLILTVSNTVNVTVNGYIIGAACACLPIAAATCYRPDDSVEIVLVKAREVPMVIHALSTLLATLPRPPLLTSETLGLLALGLTI